MTALDQSRPVRPNRRNFDPHENELFQLSELFDPCDESRYAAADSVVPSRRRRKSLNDVTIWHPHVGLNYALDQIRRDRNAEHRNDGVAHRRN
jgi:hypothetical protein